MRKAVDEWENARIEQIDRIDAAASEMKPGKAVKYLTDYSVNTAQELFDRWSALDKYLLVKYIDGNVKRETENGFEDNGYGRNIPAQPLFPGYGEKWKRAVAAGDDGTLKAK